jgi:hypothetical protein
VVLDGQLDRLAAGIEGMEVKLENDIDFLKLRFETEDVYRAKQGGWQ